MSFNVFLIRYWTSETLSYFALKPEGNPPPHTVHSHQTCLISQLLNQNSQFICLLNLTCKILLRKHAAHSQRVPCVEFSLISKRWPDGCYISITHWWWWCISPIKCSSRISLGILSLGFECGWLDWTSASQFSQPSSTW